MAGKSLKSRVSALKKKIEGVASFRDPSMTWVEEASGNVIHGRLLGLHVPGEQAPYYRVQLKDGCRVLSSSRRRGVLVAGAGMIVSVVETGDISCLRYFIDEMAAKEVFYDVWIRWMPFRQEVQVKEIREGGQHAQPKELQDDERLS